MREKVAPPDAKVADIAARQHGVISTGQLLGAGIGTHGVSRRVRAGRLHRVHRAVYAVGHIRLADEGRWIAALLACGGDAVISHRSAAELWGMLPRSGGVVHVSVPKRGGRARREGISLHRPPTLTAKETTRRIGIPVTTPARTVSDLRRTITEKEWRRAIRQADVLGLDARADALADGTRSEFERRFLLLCRRHRLPGPEVNVRIGTYLVDFLWRQRRLIVETDGYRFHRGRIAFEEDRVRDLGLRALGYEVLRLSYRQVETEPERVLDVLRDSL